jgi:hypothetical protein
MLIPNRSYRNIRAPGRRAINSWPVPRGIAPNGRRPTTLPEPIKRTRVLGFCGFAGEGNVAERSERMRAERSPSRPRIYPASVGRAVS